MIDALVVARVQGAEGGRIAALGGGDEVAVTGAIWGGALGQNGRCQPIHHEKAKHMLSLS